MASHAEEIRRQLEESARVKQSFSDELVGRIAQFAEKSAAALRNGGKIVFFGNGGSAADALHLAAELVVRLRSERRGLAALALTTNPSVLTAAGNDYGFERIFSQANRIAGRCHRTFSWRFRPAAPARISCVEWRRAGRVAHISLRLRVKPAGRSPVKWIFC